MQKNYYQILRINNNANEQQIADAYYRARDRVAQSGVDDPDTLALLKDAFETLSDARNRAAYDQSLSEPPPPPPRLRAVNAPPSGMPPMSPTPPMPAMPDMEGDDLEPAPAPGKRWMGLGIAAAAMLVTVLVGFMLSGKSSAPKAPAATLVSTSTTSSIAVSSDPIGTSEAPASTTPSNTASTAPRTGDQVFSEVAHSIVRVVIMDDSHNLIGGGSGVVTGRGTVITNCHVALKGPIIEVRAGKDGFPASVTLADETYDLCQLSVSGGFSAPAVEIGNMQYVRTGQKVFAIGAPQGLDLTISEGIVSSLRETGLGKILQTTAPISPGSSGGGLFNISGQLIGITTFQLRSGQNLNFAVPADWIAEMAPRGGPGPSLQ